MIKKTLKGSELKKDDIFEYNGETYQKTGGRKNLWESRKTIALNLNTQVEEVLDLEKKIVYIKVEVESESNDESIDFKEISFEDQELQDHYNEP